MKFSKQVENCGEKEKLLFTSTFFFSPQCFQKTCTTDTYKLRLVWESVKSWSNQPSPLQFFLQFFFLSGLPITTQCRILTHQTYKAVENIVRKGEIACNKQFLLFSQCFLFYMALIFHFKCTFKCGLQFVSIYTSLNYVVCNLFQFRPV